MRARLTLLIPAHTVLSSPCSSLGRRTRRRRCNRRSGRIAVRGGRLLASRSRAHADATVSVVVAHVGSPTRIARSTAKAELAE